MDTLRCLLNMHILCFAIIETAHRIKLCCKMFCLHGNSAAVYIIISTAEDRAAHKDQPEEPSIGREISGQQPQIHHDQSGKRVEM